MQPKEAHCLPCNTFCPLLVLLWSAGALTSKSTPSSEISTQTEHLTHQPKSLCKKSPGNKTRSPLYRIKTNSQVHLPTLSKSHSTKSESKRELKKTSPECSSAERKTEFLWDKATKLSVLCYLWRQTGNISICDQAHSILLSDRIYCTVK